MSAVHVRDNQLVKKDEVLVELDPRDFQVALEQAKANLAKDKATEITASANEKRAASLFSDKVISAQELDANVAVAQSSRGNVQADAAAVKQAELNLTYTKIKAPTDSYVVWRDQSRDWYAKYYHPKRAQRVRNQSDRCSAHYFDHGNPGARADWKCDWHFQSDAQPRWKHWHRVDHHVYRSHSAVQPERAVAAHVIVQSAVSTTTGRARIHFESQGWRLGSGKTGKGNLVSNAGATGRAYQLHPQLSVCRTCLSHLCANGALV